MLNDQDLQRIEDNAYNWQFDDLIVVDLTDDTPVGNYTDMTQHYRDTIFDLLAEVRRLRQMYETPQFEVSVQVNDPTLYKSSLL